MVFQAIDVYSNFDQTRALYKTVRLSIVGKESVTQQIKPNIFKFLEKKKCNQFDCESKAYGLTRFQDL